MIYAVRSDESTHRFVNHSLANLKSNDINPFALREPDMTVKGKKIAYVLFYVCCVQYGLPCHVALTAMRRRSTLKSRTVSSTSVRVLEDLPVYPTCTAHKNFFRS